MFKKIVLLIVLSFSLYANNLSVVTGEIRGHTEVFGDSEINPTTKEVKANLTVENSLESIKGQIFFDTLSLVSEKKDRDAHMYELLNEPKFKTISFDIKNIVKNGINYDINGVLVLNGVSKDITVKSNITEQNNQILFDGGFSFNLTDFNLEPPTMFFLTVRNQIDVTYKIDLKR
ncbi:MULTISPECIES: YceI family protein [Arcobacteraceae]|uniref:YceI family protein n=1 Tax=Aliarcobacter butzleri TaxID=28197 RepID=A0AAW6VDL0_9BACT|nr:MULTISPECIES: YceI family protein [Arcobacteraceae]MCT7908335.1 YceI family protein [Arcobacter lacus]MDK2040754.1 YceI family protein [Aliarcobacter butzleri]MDK2095384.1 YceI family protein [Aliarcobacter butzleri]